MDEYLLKQHLARAQLRRTLPDPADRRLLRKRLGLSQQQLADVLGVQRVTVARWELGARNPSDEHLEPYLTVLGVRGEEVPT